MNDDTPLSDPRRRGLMLVLSSPSGAGKTTLSKALLRQHPSITLSISATTRPARPGEIEGKDYLFVSEDEFTAMRDRGEFLEHARVFGNLYGTPRVKVLEALSQGQDVLFDIDWQGSRQLQESVSADLVAADLVTVFILPPSRVELERRLQSRAQDTEEVVAKRMAKASDEISYWAEYDYVIVNRDVDESMRQLNAILTAERLRRSRQTGLSAFVKRLRLDD